MKYNKILLIVFPVLAVVLLLMFFTAANSEEYSDKNDVSADVDQEAFTVEGFVDSMNEKGVKILDATLKNKMITVSLQIKGKEEILPEDILSLREIENAIKNPRVKDLIDSYELFAYGADGKLICSEITYRIQNIPDYDNIPTLPKNMLGNEDVADISRSIFESYPSMELTKLEAKNSSLMGKELALEYTFDGYNISNMNDLIPKIEQDIVRLNKENDIGVFVYSVLVKDSNGNPIVLLSADLLHRNFKWWQTPDLKNSWSGGGPADD